MDIFPHVDISHVVYLELGLSNQFSVSTAEVTDMKFIFAVLALAFSFSSQSIAAEMSDADIGTYEWLNPKGEPTGVLYKLGQSNNGKWVAEGFIPGQGWKNVSCDSGCEYRNSTFDEIQKYFPASWIANADISCIQNLAQAFCRYSGKTEPNRNGLVIVTLVSGNPIPVMVRKVSGN